MDTNIICPNCKEPIEPGATFCGNCGHKLDIPQPAQTQSASLTPENPLQNQMPGQGPVVGGGSSEVYSVGQPESGAEKKSIVALILGIIGIPAALLPIAGIILGIAGLILGTTARVKYKHTLNLLAIIFSIIAILAGLGLLVKNATGSKSYTQTGPFQTISTVCYKVKVDTGLRNFKHQGCSFITSSGKEDFDVIAIKDDKVNASNMSSLGLKTLRSEASSSGGTISNAHLGLFAGSKAVLADFKSSTTNDSGIFAFVVHQTVDGYNVFIMGRAVVEPGLNSFGSLETTWQWK